MSRTFRMKKKESSDWNISWLSDYTKIPVIKILHKYFGDTGVGTRNAPAAARRAANQTLRRKQNQALHTAILNGEEEELVLPKFVRNVNWDYF